jgi:uncharacterized protein involved in cysteine biosynthesis
MQQSDSARQPFMPFTGIVVIPWPQTVAESSPRRATGASEASDEVCGQAMTTVPAAMAAEAQASAAAIPPAILCAAASIVTIGFTPRPVGSTAPSTT